MFGATEVRDNGGRSFDRYTVAFAEDGYEEGQGCLLIGATGNHPQGVCMHSEHPIGGYDGVTIGFDELPAPVLAAIADEQQLYEWVVSR